MTRTFILLFSFLSIITGCEKQPHVEKQVILKDTSSAVKKDSDEKEIISDKYEGLYIVNMSYSTFQDCAHPDSIYWVEDPKDLVTEYKRIFANPSVYASVVANVRGEVMDTKNIKVKEKYPRTLRVREVVSVEKKNFTNTCVPYDYWAFGKDPEWSLQISAKENLMEFEVTSENKTYYFFYAEQKQRDGFIIYSNYNRIQRNSIEVKIIKEECMDASGKSYQFSVQVELTGSNRKYRGCAIKGKNPDIM